MPKKVYWILIFKIKANLKKWSYPKLEQQLSRGHKNDGKYDNEHY